MFVVQGLAEPEARRSQVDEVPGGVRIAVVSVRDGAVRPMGELLILVSGQIRSYPIRSDPIRSDPCETAPCGPWANCSSWWAAPLPAAQRSAAMLPAPACPCKAARAKPARSEALGLPC